MLHSPKGLARIEAVKQLDLSPLRDEHNGLNLQFTVSTWLGTLLDSWVDADKPLCLIYKFFGQLVRDYIGTVKRLKELGDKLNDSLIWSDDPSSGYISESLHAEFRKTPIFREYCEWYKTHDPSLYSYILTFLWFGKKAEFIDPRFEAKAFQSWCEVEYELEKHVFPEHVLDDLAAIVAESGLAINYDDLVFKHGPGYVSEEKVGRSFYKKTMTGVRFVQEIDETLHQLMREFGSAYPKSTTFLPDPGLWEKGRSSLSERSITWSRASYVPNDVTKARSICMEPVAYMHAQQAVMHALDKGIQRSRYSLLVNIHDQQRNRDSALRSSRDRKLACLDLSNASDRAHVRLISIFPLAIRDLLLGTRTSKVKTIHGHVVEVNKFAPMGSALCFPIQSIIFASVIFLAEYLEKNGIPVSTYLNGDCPVFMGELSCQEGCCAYGDDLMVPNSQAGTVISLLTALGFEVNTRKSFFGNQVLRESCGVYCVDGFLVSPILNKVKGLLDLKPSMYQSMIDLANRLFDAGMFSTRDILLSWIPRDCYVLVSERMKHRHAKPNEEDNPFGLLPGHVLSFEIDNSRLKSRNYKRWQQLQYRIRMAKTPSLGYALGYPDQECETPLDRYLYNLWLQDPFLTEGNKPPIGDAGEPAMRWVWTPAH